jgi:hypothetical protein
METMDPTTVKIPVNTYTGLITKLDPYDIFVFGSNKNGFHGAGSAGWAMLGVYGNRWRKVNVPGTNMKLNEVPDGTKGFAAVKGKAHGYQVGLYGRSYAIQTVTVPRAKRSVTEEFIIKQINRMYTDALKNPAYRFLIAGGVGKSLNGYSNEEMSAMYKCQPIPSNVWFNNEFYNKYMS